jgi:integrase
MFNGGQRDLAAAFDAYLERVNRSAGTRQIYTRAVRELIDGEAESSVTALMPADIDAFLGDWRGRFWTEHGRPPSPATYRNRINALRAFYAWLDRFDLLRDAIGSPLQNPMRQIIAPRAEQKRNDWLQPAEDAALLDCPTTPTERIVVRLLRWTGMRVSEAHALRVKDVDLAPGLECIFVRKSKTDAGQRQIPVPPSLGFEIERWRSVVEGRWRSDTDPFLVGQSGRALPTSYMWRLVKRVAFRGGVRPVLCSCATSSPSRHEAGCARSVSGENMSRVTPHTLRRTFATDLLNRGLRLEVVSRLLGHASTTVTEKAYAELLDDTTRRELFAALGAGALTGDPDRVLA